MRVLCIAAHPDDEVLGVGGTLLRHKAAGDDVSVAVIFPCREESTEEGKEAERRMGIPYRWFDPDIELIVKRAKPDVVYTHSSADLHADHRFVHERVLVATRPESGVRAIYAFETPSATDWGLRPFVPQRFVDIGAVVDDKMHAMEAYASELRDQPHPRNIDALLTRAESWGQRAGVGWAEAFEVIRECA